MAFFISICRRKCIRHLWERSYREREYNHICLLSLSRQQANALSRKNAEDFLHQFNKLQCTFPKSCKLF